MLYILAPIIVIQPDPPAAFWIGGYFRTHLSVLRRTDCCRSLDHSREIRDAKPRISRPHRIPEYPRFSLIGDPVFATNPNTQHESDIEVAEQTAYAVFAGLSSLPFATFEMRRVSSVLRSLR